MAKKSSYMLAVLFIANPFVLLMYQNCSSPPKQVVAGQSDKMPASVAKPVIGPKEKLVK